MSKETDSLSKFRFWVGVAAVGFIVMAVTPEGIVVGPLLLGYCFAVIFAMIAAVPASQPKSVVVSDVNMMSVMGGSEHQVMTPDKLISRLTEKSTAQGMANAAALRQGFGLGFAVGLAPILIFLGSLWVISEGPWREHEIRYWDSLREFLLVISIMPSIAVYFASEKRRLRTLGSKSSFRMELGMLCGFFGGGGIIGFLYVISALSTIP